MNKNTKNQDDISPLSGSSKRSMKFITVYMPIILAYHKGSSTEDVKDNKVKIVDRKRMYPGRSIDH